MRAFIFILSAAALFLLGCGRGSSDTTGVSLSFYVLTDAAPEKGRFLDTPDFPKLGYISAQPDLTIISLVAVEPLSPPTTLAVIMRPNDAKQFTALTERAVGKRVAITLGDVPLAGITITAPIPTPTDSISISLPKTADPQKALNELRRLVR